MIRRLSLLWKRFTPLEERLFVQIRNVLPTEAQPIEWREPERLRSSRASRFAARKNGPYAAGLTVQRRLESSERQPESGSATG